jgi:hypothetical protein
MEPQKTPQSSLPDNATPRPAPNDTPVPDASVPADPAGNSFGIGNSPSAAVIPPYPTPAGPVALAPKPRKKGLIIGLIAAGVVVVLLGGAAAAYAYLLNKPENILKMALANTVDKEKSKTMHFSGALAVEEQSSATTVEATYKGAGSNESGAFDLNAKLDILLTNITFDARSTDGKTVYLRVGGLDGLAELLGASGTDAAGAAPLIAQVNNQWFEVNESLIRQLGGNAIKETLLSDADIKKLKDAYQKHDFLVVKETLDSEEINGVKSHHYKVVVDEARLKQFGAAIKSANLDSIKLTSDQLKDFNRAIDDSDLAKYPFEIWISKKTKQITQVVFEAREDGNRVSFRFTVDGYNQPVKVEAPEDAKSILEVLGGFLNGGEALLQGTGTMDNLLPGTAGTGNGISL